MAENKESVDLEKALDESLSELQKAAGEETISKAAKEDKKEDEDAKGGKKPPFLFKKKDEDKKEDEDAKGDEKKDEDEDAKGDKKEDEDAKGDEKKEDEDAKGDKDEKDEDEEAMRGGYQKSVQDTLTKSQVVSNAIEVSKFLREMTKGLSEVIGDLTHRVRKLEKSNRALSQALVKSYGVQNEVIKSLGSEMASFGGKALPRKSVDGVVSIAKSFRHDEKGDGKPNLTKSEISGRLADLEMTGKVPMGTTTRFEMNGELHKSFEKLVLEK